MLTLIWRDRARLQAVTAFTYIAEHDRPAAERLLAAIEACAERIPEHPYMHRPGASPERGRRWCIRTIF